MGVLFSFVDNVRRCILPDISKGMVFLRDTVQREGMRGIHDCDWENRGDLLEKRSLELKEKRG